MLTLDIFGDTKTVLKQFDEIQDRLQHPNAGYQRAAMRMYRDVIDHFRQEKNPDGSTWAEWSPAYAAKRGSGKKLQDRGILRGSILFQGLDTDARVWTEVPYAPPHQYGLGNMPARTFMWLSDGALKGIEEDWVKWTIGQMSMGF